MVNRMIIIEGHDNSGKSTLGKYLADQFDLDTQESEGPPKSAEEFADRIERYYSLAHGHIFVRHPCVSEAIYGPVIRGHAPLTQQMLDKFYGGKHIFIYCDPGSRGLEEHNIKPNETQQHLDGVQHNYAAILGAYRLWAIGKAHIFYRIGDNMETIADMLFGLRGGYWR